MRIIPASGLATSSILLYQILSASAAHLHQHGALTNRAFHQHKEGSGNIAREDLSDLIDVVAPAAAPEVDCATGNCSEASNENADSSPARIEAVQQLGVENIEKVVSTIATPTRRRSGTRLSNPPASTGTLPKTEEWLSLDIIHEVAEIAYGNRWQDKLASKSISNQLELRGDSKNRLQPRQQLGQYGAYQSFALGNSPQPSTTISAQAAGTSALCPSANGTTYKSASGISYQVLCNIDFPGHDFPFVKVGSLEECILRCDVLNWIVHGVECLAGIFVPSRIDDDDDCYLKSSVDNPTYTTFTIHGLVRLDAIQAVASRSAADSSSTAAPTGTSVVADSSTAVAMTTSNQATATPSTLPPANELEVAYASGDQIIEPVVAATHLHGPTVNKPTNQWIKMSEPGPVMLAANLLQNVANDVLTTSYDIAPQTGVLSLNSSTQQLLTPIQGTPHMSRDGGVGGYLNGQHLFVFCDTGSYTAPTAQVDGEFQGFVASSVAIDIGMNGVNNQAIFLQDGIGQWQNEKGRQRGFAPMTEGELAYNLKLQGNGQRYAIWPEASLLPLNSTTGIIIAPIVWDDVDFTTRKYAFTYTGATLLTITADNKAGPIAERTVPKLFNQDEVEWGCAGGIRSWGPSGIGGNDGYVYVFGNIKGGVLLARTTSQNVADRNSYEYWNAGSWTTQMLTENSDAFFIEGVFMDINLFYSPRHLTFIIVYLTTYADNTFHFRYLLADHAIRPQYAPDGEEGDFVENIYKYKWSDEQFLYKAPPSLSGKYVYAGGVHAGYYGTDDIANGGSRMLLSWTAPTGQTPQSTTSEYQIITAGIDWE